MNRFGGVAATVVGLISLAACGIAPTQGGSTSSTPTTTVLEDAAEWCEAATDVVQDEGRSLTLDTMGQDEDIGDDLEVVTCVLTELGAPDYVIEHIESTRALDGQQTDEWDDIEARWTYHPDVGMKLTLIDRS